jgi:hypothetical protein
MNKILSLCFGVLFLAASAANGSFIGATNAISNPGFQTLYEHDTTTPVTFNTPIVYSNGLTDATLGTVSPGAYSGTSPIDVPDWTQTLDINNGVQLLGTSYITANSTNTYYINYADGTSGGTIGTYQDITSPSGSLTFAPNTTYQLSVEVDFSSRSATILNPYMGISFGVPTTSSNIVTPSSTGANAEPASGGSAIYTFNYTTTSSVSASDLYVFLGFASGGSTASTGQINYDNLSLVQTPEPASACLVGIAGAALLLRRQRRLAV